MNKQYFILVNAMVRTLLGVGLVLMGSIYLSGFSYAQSTCTACNDTPPDLQAYLDAMDELIKLLPVDENTAVRQGTGVSTALSRIKQGANIQEVIITDILTPGTDHDLYADVNMVYREESIQRDWRKLLDVQIAIINRTIAMVNAKQQIVLVSDDVAQQMNTILKTKLKYIELAKNAKGEFDLSHDGLANYKNLAQILWQIHMMYQDFHEEVWFDKQFYSVGQGYYKTNDQDIEKAIQTAEDNTLNAVVHDILSIRDERLVLEENKKLSVDTSKYITFINKDVDFIAYIWQISSDYGCSLGLARNECLTERQEMRKDISYLFKERLVSDSQRAMNTFKSSWGRLKGAFGRGSTEDKDAAKQREKSLLNSYRGTEYPSKEAFWKVANVSSTIEPHPVWVETLWKTVDKAWKYVSNDISGKKNAPKKTTPSENLDTVSQGAEQPDRNDYTTKDEKKQKLQDSAVIAQVQDERKEQYDFLGSFNKDTLTTRKAESMQATFKSVLELQNKLRTESVFTDVNRTTKRFPLLSAAVYANMKILGKKNPTSEAEGGWYYAMSQVCELQCQNVNGKTCQHFGN